MTSEMLSIFEGKELEYSVDFGLYFGKQKAGRGNGNYSVFIQ